MKRQSNRGCSKRCVQQGRRHLDARSVLIVREHDKGPTCLRACALERLQRVNVKPLRPLVRQSRPQRQARRQGTPLTPFFNILIINTPQTLSPLNQEDILGPHLYAMVIRQNLPDMDEFKLAHTIPSSHPAGVESMVQNMTEEHP